MGGEKEEGRLRYDQLLARIKRAVEDKLSTYLRYEFGDISHITQKMLLDSVEGSGKRLRPIISFLISRILDVKKEYAFAIACAIELSHAFTLVHDDMIDEPVSRRGKPPLFRSFGDDLALLAGDMLLVLSYSYLSLCKGEGVRDAISFFSRQMKQVIEGQILDVLWGRTVEQVSGEVNSHLISVSVRKDAHDIIDIQARKTSSLFKIACVLPSFFSSYGKRVRKYLESYGYHFGLAFQILDDISDVEEDRRSGAPNILIGYGEEATKRFFTFHRQKAILSLRKFFDETGGKTGSQARKILKYLTESILDYEKVIQGISVG